MKLTGLGFLLLVLPMALASQEVNQATKEDLLPNFVPTIPSVEFESKWSSRHDEARPSKVCTMGIKCGQVHTELPIQGIMGEKGPQGETGPPGRPGVPGPPGESWRNDCNVAFYAGLSASHDFSYLKEAAPLVFDKVVTNRGDAYKERTGKFIAPYEGTYIFYVTVSAYEESKAAVKVYVNGTFLSTVWAESFNDWGSASNTYILDLAAGDEVWLMVIPAAHRLYAGMYTSFSGMCLWRNDLEG